ncbi:MAG: hypothetical protein OD918_04540, partial [Gammaproteobacteria bacterium]
MARARAAQARAVNAALNAAYGDGATTFTSDRAAKGDLPRNFRALRGAHYAVYGADYYLSAAEFVLLPDGTITPPFIEVRNLQPAHDRDKTARLALFAASGDKKYNRMSGGVAAEMDIHFAGVTPLPPPPPADLPPQVELYLGPYHAQNTEGVVAHPQRGASVEKVWRGRARPVMLKARLHDRHSGESVAATSDIRLQLADLPPVLLAADQASRTYTFNAGKNERVYAPMPRTLTIAAGESSAATANFVIFPPLNADAPEEFSVVLPAPRIVTAAGAPAGGEITAFGRSVKLLHLDGASVQVNVAIPASDMARVFDPLIPDMQRLTEWETGAPGALVTPAAEITAIVAGAGARALRVPVTLICRAPTNGVVEGGAGYADFMRRLPDGSFVPLPPPNFGNIADCFEFYDAPALPASARPDDSLLSGGQRAIGVPVYLRQDGLVEGDETFNLKIDGADSGTAPSGGQYTAVDDEESVTIAANGVVALRAHLSAGGTPGATSTSFSEFTVTGRLVPSDIKRETFRDDLAEKNPGLQAYETETLVPSRVNFGISLGVAGGSLTYADADQNIVLVYTDTTGISGAGAADGLLTGDELTATSDDWIFNRTSPALSISGALPGNLQAFQFPAATLDTTGLSMISFAEPNVTLAVPESGPAIPRLTLLLDPPLKTAAVAHLIAIGAASGNNFTASGGDDEFADVHAMREITLPANRSVVVVALPNVRNDFMVEPRETFRLELRSAGGAPGGIVAPMPGKSDKTIEIVDDDVTRFRVEPRVNNVLRARDLRAGQIVSLRGHLDAVVQIGDGDGAGSAVVEVSVTDQAREDDALEFFDADADGYLRGAELASRPLDVEVDFLAKRFDFSVLTYRNTDLAADAFRFPRAADPGREKSRWNADLLLLAEERPVAPVAPAAVATGRDADMVCPAVVDGDSGRLRVGTCCETGADGNTTCRESDLRVALSVRHSATAQTVQTGNAVANARTAMRAGIWVALNVDVDVDARVVLTARHEGEDGVARYVRKPFDFLDFEDSKSPLRTRLILEDYIALGLRHDPAINRPQIITTTFAFDAQTKRRLRDDAAVAFSDAPVRGPDIVFADNESAATEMRVFLVDAAGQPITQLPAGKRTDAFVKLELQREQSVLRDGLLLWDFKVRRDAQGNPILNADGERIAINTHVTAPAAVVVTEQLAFDLGVSGMNMAELGYPDIPRMVLEAGKSSAMSERAMRITPNRQGSFSFVVRAMLPQRLGGLTRHNNVEVTHNAADDARAKWQVTLSEAAVEVNEGDTGLRAMITMTDGLEGAAPFLRGGAEEAVDVQYEILALRDGASNADLALPGAPAPV